MLRVIVSFGREQYEFDRFREQGEPAVDERVKLTVRQTLFTLLVSTITAAGTAFVLGFGVLPRARGPARRSAKLIVLMSYVAAVYQPLEQISELGRLLQHRARAASRIVPAARHRARGRRGPGRDRRSAGRGAKSTYEDVSFSYHGPRGHAARRSRFEAQPGQRIAIVGPTGAGKTTLISLLPRFYDPRDGRILLDGIDLRKLKLHSLREQISLVLQEPLLFSGTIAENIRYGRLDATHGRRDRGGAGRRTRTTSSSASRRGTRPSSASGARSSPAASASASASPAPSSRTRRS